MQSAKKLERERERVCFRRDKEEEEVAVRVDVQVSSEKRQVDKSEEVRKKLATARL